MLWCSLQSYPMPDVDTRELDIIPGGPKLARTPIGPAHSGARSVQQLPSSPQPHDNTMSPEQQVHSWLISSPCEYLITLEASLPPMCGFLGGRCLAKSLNRPPHPSVYVTFRHLTGPLQR